MEGETKSQARRSVTDVREATSTLPEPAAELSRAINATDPLAAVSQLLRVRVAHCSELYPFCEKLSRCTADTELFARAATIINNVSAVF